MFTPGPLQLLIVLAIVLLLFGSRLPSLARSFGQSITEFKKGIKEVEDHSDDSTHPGKTG
ncbi:Sec-independent protein translocase subunit TatA/TatB [Botrimarina hoheduenensis]|uniref:Sec-independent protein translocase protein TatA n=1 Tax=Botrimarina hoheduenensis TaxID=2528000 RepID=A0A5C5W942_9BACT|nr:twin-arginine translocase TatA/TatE family subunit [Botrimarina hoheduenensis]TWT47180.1 twin arginine translocase protein A [Botrimarina hoheduenensis]